MPANKLLAIDSLGEKISNNFQSGKQPLFGVAFPFVSFILFLKLPYIENKVILAYEENLPSNLFSFSSFLWRWFRIEEQNGVYKFEDSILNN